jgi:hypothetical protein
MRSETIYLRLIVPPGRGGRYRDGAPSTGSSVLDFAGALLLVCTTGASLGRGGSAGRAADRSDAGSDAEAGVSSSGSPLWWRPLLCRDASW